MKRLNDTELETLAIEALSTLPEEARRFGAGEVKEILNAKGYSVSLDRVQLALNAYEARLYEEETRRYQEGELVQGYEDAGTLDVTTVANENCFTPKEGDTFIGCTIPNTFEIYEYRTGWKFINTVAGDDGYRAALTYIRKGYEQTRLLAEKVIFEGFYREVVREVNNRLPLMPWQRDLNAN